MKRAPLFCSIVKESSPGTPPRLRKLNISPCVIVNEDKRKKNNIFFIFVVFVVVVVVVVVVGVVGVVGIVGVG